MGDDSRVPPLTPRAPGESGMRMPRAHYTRVVLPESVVQRVRAALETSREQAALQKSDDVQEPAASPELTAFPAAPESAARSARHPTPASPWFPDHPDDDTQQFPAITLSAGSDTDIPVRDVTSAPAKRDVTSTPAKRDLTSAPAKRDATSAPAKRD